MMSLFSGLAVMPCIPRDTEWSLRVNAILAFCFAVFAACVAFGVYWQVWR